VALDLGDESPLLPGLVHPGLRPLRTTYEGDFGEPLGDIYYTRVEKRCNAGLRGESLADQPHNPDKRHGSAHQQQQGAVIACLQQLWHAMRTQPAHAAQDVCCQGAAAGVLEPDSGSMDRTTSDMSLLCFPRHL
jgi:hypothetical protein